MTDQPMMFGSEVLVRRTDDGNAEQRLITKFRNGEIALHVAEYSETVSVTSEPEVVSEFLKLLEYVTGDPKRSGLTFVCKTNAKTGFIDKVVKGWSEKA